MTENNVNINNESPNEETKEAKFRSCTLMTKELHWDFSLVSYNRIKKMFIIFFCFIVFEVVSNIAFANYEIVGITLFVSFVMLLLYLVIKRTTRITYERNLVAQGKDTTFTYELFDDKIVSSVEGLIREYSYHQITKFFETKNFLLLHLQHNLFIVINKNTVNADVTEVKSFLIKKCLLVKNKKFIPCYNDKACSLAFLIATIAVSVIGVFVSMFLKFNAGL